MKVEEVLCRKRFQVERRRSNMGNQYWDPQSGWLMDTPSSPLFGAIKFDTPVWVSWYGSSPKDLDPPKTNRFEKTPSTPPVKARGFDPPSRAAAHPVTAARGAVKQNTSQLHVHFGHLENQ